MRLLARFLIVFVLILLPFIATAQHFEWVEKYTGGEATSYQHTNNIIQSVIDSSGNVFFVGTCAVTAGFHGNKFLSINPYGPFWNTVCIVIGKLSADGELLWSKIIHGNNGALHPFGSMQVIGDTAIACFVHRVCLPEVTPRSWSSSNKYIYYLDTTYNIFEGDSIVYNGTCLYNSEYFCANAVSAYIVFDMEGNILEHHWLTVALLNNSGEPFTAADEFPGYQGFDKMVQVNNLSDQSNFPIFVDDKGNIIISRALDNRVFVYDSLVQTINTNTKSIIRHTDSIVSGMRFYVDGKTYFDVQLPENRPSVYPNNCQILKFSPHFEELLANQFLFEPTLEHLDTIGNIDLFDLKCDDKNNIYVSGRCYYNLYGQDYENSLTIGGNDSLSLSFSCTDFQKGFLVKYDTALNPLYLKTLDCVCSGSCDAHDVCNSSLFTYFQFDEKGDLFLGAGTNTFDTLNVDFYYDSTRIDVDNNGMMLFRLKPDNGKLLGYTHGVESPSASGAPFVASGNRIIRQIVYRDYLNFAGREFRMPQPYEYGMGFAVWDYDGNELYYVDYGVNGSSNNRLSSVCLHDSILYLTGMLASGGARFGNINVPNAGMSQSFIAKYVDTAFMHPYVGGGSQDIQLLVRDGEPLVTVYPNPCTQRVTVSYDGAEPLQAAILTDLSGRQHTVTLTAAGEGRYTVDFSALPSASYLLTLVTSSGQRITSRLLKR